MRSSSILFALSSLAISASAHADCLLGTQFQRRQVPQGSTQGSSGKPTFSYSGATGPTNWHEIDPANSACGTGNFQSPIVLNGSIPFAPQPPVMQIPDIESARFDNLGSTLQVTLNGTTTYDGQEYALRQFHFHTPSEHRVNDEFFPLEMHMVHEGAAGIEVVTFFFELHEGENTTDLLTSVIQNLDQVQNVGNSTQTGPLRFGPLIDMVHTKPLYTYNGSLTTPPCTEGITFLIVEEPLPIDVRTFNRLKHVMKFNARYAQNGLGGDNLLEITSGLSSGQFVEAGVPGGNATDVVVPNTTPAENSDAQAAPAVQQRSSSAKFRV